MKIDKQDECYDCLTIKQRLAEIESLLIVVDAVISGHGQDLDLLKQQVEIRDRIPLKKPADIVQVVANVWQRLDALETISRDIKPVFESYESSLNDLAERMVAIERMAQGIVDSDAGGAC